MIPQIVVIGASSGGPAALQALLSGLPTEFPAPVVIVLPRGKQAGSDPLRLLQRASRLPIREPEDKEGMAPGRIYLAPGDYHLLLEKGHFALSLEAPEHHARPSIDLLFESAADAYGEGVMGIILTGAGDDGARGLAQIKARGGLTIVQDPTTAEAPALPEAAIEATEVDQVLPLPQIARFLNSLCPAIAR